MTPTPSPNRVKNEARFRYRFLIEFCSILARFWPRFGGQSRPKRLIFGMLFGGPKKDPKMDLGAARRGRTRPGAARKFAMLAPKNKYQYPFQSPLPSPVPVSSPRFPGPEPETGNSNSKLVSRVSCYLLLVACYLELVLTCCLLLENLWCGPGHAKRAGGTVADLLLFIMYYN